MSWTNDTVKLNTIPKGNAPVVNSEALWLAADSKNFFMYDGDESLSAHSAGKAPPGNELWEFTPSNALGSWSRVPIPPSSNFTTLTRATEGAYASGNGLGFALGGYVDEYTSTAFGNAFNVPGLVVYNSSSQQWYNISSTGYSFKGGIGESAGIFVPSFGPAGLLFIFGGTASDTFATFNYAYMYEPLSQQWKLQQTTGAIPGGVTQPCVVGVGSGSGSYEASHSSFRPAYSDSNQ